MMSLLPTGGIVLQRMILLHPLLSVSLLHCSSSSRALFERAMDVSGTPHCARILFVALGLLSNGWGSY